MMPLSTLCHLSLRRGTILVLVAIPCSAFADAVSFAETAMPEIRQEESTSASRVRLSMAYYRFTLDDRKFSGWGPEFAYDVSLGQKWTLGAGIGQAYSMQSSLTSLFTSLDVSLWYSVWGNTRQVTHWWKGQSGYEILKYRRYNASGFRLGFGMEQYFFNTSSAVVPFSGISVKAFYQIGLEGPYDIGFGGEMGQLRNADRKASSWRVLLSFLWWLS